MRFAFLRLTSLRAAFCWVLFVSASSWSWLCLSGCWDLIFSVAAMLFAGLF
jgi:hypothetical protein